MSYKTVLVHVDDGDAAARRAASRPPPRWRWPAAAT